MKLLCPIKMNYLNHCTEQFLNLPHWVVKNSDLFRICLHQAFFLDKFISVSIMATGTSSSKSSTMNCLKYKCINGNYRFYHYFTIQINNGNIVRNRYDFVTYLSLSKKMLL
jgi:hypothetical protein